MIPIIWTATIFPSKSSISAIETLSLSANHLLSLFSTNIPQWNPQSISANQLYIEPIVSPQLTHYSFDLHFPSISIFKPNLFVLFLHYILLIANICVSKFEIHPNPAT